MRTSPFTDPLASKLLCTGLKSRPRTGPLWSASYRVINGLRGR
jgi:hypothetical protein